MISKEKKETLNQAKAKLEKLQCLRREAEEKLKQATSEKKNILDQYSTKDFNNETLNEMLKMKLSYDPEHLSQIIEDFRERENEINKTIAEIVQQIRSEERSYYKDLFFRLIEEIQEAVNEKISKAWVVGCRAGGINRESFNHHILFNALSNEALTKAEKELNRNE